MSQKFIFTSTIFIAIMLAIVNAKQFVAWIKKTVNLMKKKFDMKSKFRLGIHCLYYYTELNGRDIFNIINSHHKYVIKKGKTYLFGEDQFIPELIYEENSDFIIEIPKNIIWGYSIFYINLMDSNYEVMMEFNFQTKGVDIIIPEEKIFPKKNTFDKSCQIFFAYCKLCQKILENFKPISCYIGVEVYSIHDDNELDFNYNSEFFTDDNIKSIYNFLISEYFKSGKKLLDINTGITNTK